MSRPQQTLLMKYFSPETIKKINELEGQSHDISIEKLDWGPFYQSWPELKKILRECKEEVRQNGLVKLIETQRPQIKEYILVKLGKKKKAQPVLLSQEVIKIIDQFLIRNR